MKKSAVLALILGATLQVANALDIQTPTMPPGGQLSDEHVFSGFGCTGKNQSPAVSWKNAPKGTKSYAVTLYDPDAPTGSGWWHWVVFNIPATASGIEAGASNSTAMPSGSVEARNDNSTIGFMGACPPAGGPKHPYQLTVWALKDALSLTGDVSPALVGFYLNALVIEKTTVTSYLGR